MGKELAGTPIDLGDGFYSYSWNLEIGEKETLSCFLSAGNLKVINAGFAPARYEPIYAMESFPRRINQWVISIINESGQRHITLYLIAKK
ncbi:hypothetical protein [Paenibacillus alvei]|uniref:Uncharacterized protein n=1 Tax=Paenibacillus alvei TaxID=44250 RepID=A0AAP7DL16_PAEAL|nr:hypothetical protein [Paenibacillus alvei]NEZ45175.1 hypothetical protein [Paenibacillus alvei]NOJ73615.1 hypothetical protein [Paenibacillus alvei]